MAAIDNFVFFIRCVTSWFDEPRALFTAFSLYTNVRDLLTPEPKNSKSIECFHGLRALSAFWVIGGHRIFRTGLMVSKPVKIESLFSQFVVAILMTNGYAVDVFFAIAGVLVTQSCLRSLHAKKFNLFKIYIGRYARYIPTVAVLLLFFLSSFPSLLVYGPAIAFLNTQIATCHKYWWSSLLLIQNYVNVNNVCLPATWYLSADFQLFLLSPIFIFLLWKFKYKVFWLFAVIIFASQIGIFFASYNNSIPDDTIYRQAHFRAAQFLLGIALGYIIYEGDGKRYMRKRLKCIGWFVSLSMFLAVEIYHETHKNQRFSEAFYASTHRIVWVILVCWIIYVCHCLQSGGIVNWFLSQPLWQPIARISLSIYLIHDIYIIMSSVNMEGLWLLNTSWLFHIIIGDMCISTLLGAIVFLAIEAPSNLVLKCILR